MENAMLKKLKTTVQKAARFDPFSRIDSALQDQQGRIDELDARIETLSSVQEWYDIATRHLGIGIAIISRTRQVLWANAFLGELVGNPGSGFCHTLLCGSSRQCSFCGIDAVLAGSVPKSVYPVILHARNGRMIDADATAMPVLDAGGTIIGAVEIVIPKTTDSAVRLQGSVTRGLIIPVDESPAPSARQFETTVTNTLPEDDQEVQHGPLNMNIVIEEYLTSPKFLQLHSAYPYVCFTNNLESDLDSIAGAAIDLIKCLNTLLTLAAEGVSGIGEVHVRTRNIRRTAPEISAHQLTAGEYIAISISDIGDPGRARVSDEQGRESRRGRPGLESVRGVMRAHQGQLVVENQSGSGTVFTLYLPVRLVKAVPPPLPEQSMSAVAGKTILVIDDMTDQRALAATILRQLGYTVSSVRSGEDAVSHIRALEVDLVLLNMIMFGMDGLETYRQIKQIKPDQKVLLVSGYSVNTKLRQTQEVSGCSFIKKPYRIETLGPAVAQELGLEPEKRPASRKFPLS